MGCAHQFRVKNPHYNPLYPVPEYYIVPCGKCANCLSTRTKQIELEANYELKQFNYGSFVTFTYDNPHLLSMCKAVQVNGETVFSLDYTHFQLFLKRLRQNISRKINSDITKLNRGISPNFKYIVCGEYGDKFGRCHFHCLFFGLDWKICRSLFELSWKDNNGFIGLIDSKPIKDGALRYVLKYMSKSLTTEENKKLYDNVGLQRPFFKRSKGFGKGLYLDNLDYIKTHNISIWNGRYDMVIPRYWRNKLHLPLQKSSDYLRDKLLSSGIKPDRIAEIPSYTQDTLSQYDRFYSLLSEEKAIDNMRNKGIPMFDVDKSCPI